MQKSMRRSDRQTDEGTAMEILAHAPWGVLSTVSEDGEPYGVPLSHAVFDGHIWFHCAAEGRKLDNILIEPRVSFCAANNVEPVFDGHFSTTFESVVVFGRAQRVADASEKRRALMAISEKYLPQHMDQAPAYIDRLEAGTVVVKIKIEQITGKAKLK